MSTGQGLKLKMDNNMPRAFQWVIAASASSELTMGEMNKKMNMCPAAEWMTLICMPPFFVFGTAGAANIVCSKPFWTGFPWCVPVIMLAGVYPAVVFLAMEHMTLFLPEAPFAAREALFNVGYKGIGVAVALITALSMLFVDQPWVLITWACLQIALIAVIVAFWLCLVRAYGKQGATGTKL